MGFGTRTFLHVCSWLWRHAWWRQRCTLWGKLCFSKDSFSLVIVSWWFPQNHCRFLFVAYHLGRCLSDWFTWLLFFPQATFLPCTFEKLEQECEFFASCLIRLSKLLCSLPGEKEHKVPCQVHGGTSNVCCKKPLCMAASHLHQHV